MKSVYKEVSITIGIDFGNKYHGDKSAAAIRCENCSCLIGHTTSDDKEKISITIPKECPQCGMEFKYIRGALV